MRRFLPSTLSSRPHRNRRTHLPGKAGLLTPILSATSTKPFGYAQNKFSTYVLTACLLLGAINAFAQLDQACITVGGTGDDVGESIVQTSDGGYAVAGRTESFGAGNEDVYVVKLDAAGIVAWTRTVGGEDRDYGYSIVQTVDGGYAVAGYTASFDVGGGDLYVVKLDAAGAVSWTRTVGGHSLDVGASMVQTVDGGYAVAGYTYSYGAGSYDVYVVKLDAAGAIAWTRTVGGADTDQGYSIIQTIDGGYALTGRTYSFGAGNGDVYVVKLDAAGTVSWTRTVGGINNDWGYSIVQTVDGGYAVAGNTWSIGAGSNNVYVIKLDATGAVSWTRTVRGARYDYGYSIVQTSDGGFAVAGDTQSYGAGLKDVYVVKLDAAGAVSWTRTVGGTRTDRGYSIVQTADGGYAVAGDTYSYGAGNGDLYVIKLDSDGISCCTREAGGISDSGGISYYGGVSDSVDSESSSPAPVVDSGGVWTNTCMDTPVEGLPPVLSWGLKIIRFDLNSAGHQLTAEISAEANTSAAIEVFNTLGHRVLHKPVALTTGKTQVTVDVSRLTAGRYMYRVVQADKAHRCSEQKTFVKK